MIGLTPQELVQITEFVQKYHRFGYIPEEERYNNHEGYCIKYIDACYDSRQGDYWCISFRGFGKIIFSTNSQMFDGYTSLFDWIMAFLKYEWREDKRYRMVEDKEDRPLINPFPNGLPETEWDDADMIEAYCADLKDREVQDTIDACKWISEYRKRKYKNEKMVNRNKGNKS